MEKRDITRGKRRAFTVIELLVVISIVSLMASLVMVGITDARKKSLVARTQTELVGIRNAINILAFDTGLWPNGCTIETFGSPGISNEIDLSSQSAGLREKPDVGTGDPPECEWTPQAVANWDGPYVGFQLVDPWGTPYWFDNDYETFLDCPAVNPKPGTMKVIVSAGPNKVGPPYALNGYSYDCDNVHLQLAL